MPLPSAHRLQLAPDHLDTAGVVGLISIEESFACAVESTGREVPWEILIADRIEDSSSLRCDQVVADIDRLAKELAAEFATLFGAKLPSERTC